jgi:hypothetical protein
VFPYATIRDRKEGFQRLIQSSPDIDASKVVKMRRCPWCERDMPEEGFAPMSLVRGEPLETVCAECQGAVASIEADGQV